MTMALLATSAVAPAQSRGDLPAGSLPPVPWANKLFLPDIDEDRARPAPAVITHDFGVLPKGTLAIHKFTITNIYDVPMQITQIRRSSEALQAYPPMRVLQANDKAEFVVTIDTSSQTGPIAETVQVSVGPTHVSTATLRLTATSRADVMLAPGAVNFGNVLPGATPSRSVTLEYSGKQKDWAVTGFLPPAGPFDVQVTDAGRGKTKITVALKGKLGNASGSLDDTVQLRTNDPTTPVISVNITGLLLAPLEVGTSKVSFADVKVGETATFRVIVRGNGVGPFRIESLADAGDGLSVQTLNAPAPTHTIVVTFAPVKAGPLTKTLRLPTDLKSGATVDLLVEATATP